MVGRRPRMRLMCAAWRDDRRTAAPVHRSPRSSMRQASRRCDEAPHRCRRSGGGRRIRRPARPAAPPPGSAPPSASRNAPWVSRSGVAVSANSATSVRVCAGRQLAEVVLIARDHAVARRAARRARRAGLRAPPAAQATRRAAARSCTAAPARRRLAASCLQQVPEVGVVERQRNVAARASRTPRSRCGEQRARQHDDEPDRQRMQMDPARRVLARPVREAQRGELDRQRAARCR